MGVTPETEMLAAIKAQETKPIYLLDRDVRVTLKRTFSEMRFRKTKTRRIFDWGFMGFGERVDAKN